MRRLVKRPAPPSVSDDAGGNNNIIPPLQEQGQKGRQRPDPIANGDGMNGRGSKRSNVDTRSANMMMGGHTQRQQESAPHPQQVTKAVRSCLPSSHTQTTSSPFGPRNRIRGSRSKRNRRNRHNVEVDWHREIRAVANSHNGEGSGDGGTIGWNEFREKLRAAAALRSEQKLLGASFGGGVVGGLQFWNKRRRKQQQQISQSISSNGGSATLPSTNDDLGLRTLDDQGRTALYAVLACKDSSRCPVDVVLDLIKLDPQAARIPNDRGRFPLHISVLYRHDTEVVTALVDAYPGALCAADNKDQTPLSYAIEMARNATHLKDAPNQRFWMTTEDSELVRWQQEQTQRWSTVHWLLLSAATNQKTSLLSVIVSESAKPVLVDALLYAAPPSIVQLLIGASVALLRSETDNNKASAFAGSTLYSCIARHYPYSILQSLTLQCPPDVRAVRDETGMGLVSAQFVSGMFQQDHATQEWKVRADLFALMNFCIQQQHLSEDEDPGFLDWWCKIEYLLTFCDRNESFPKPTADEEEKNSSRISDLQDMPSEYLLHCALRNSDVPPIVVRMLCALYPESMDLPDLHATHLFPIHLAAMGQEYTPRNYEFQIMGGESTAVAGVLLERCPEMAYYRDPITKRLPIHFAIAAGKMYKSLEVFLWNEKEDSDWDSNDEQLLSMLEQRDPETGLYPFQQAATYTIVSTRDGHRWSCVARNKYSHAVWKGLTDRQKATSILRVAEAEDVSRIDTIYELLRRRPGVLRPSRTIDTISAFRNERGMGMIASHYISFCYSPDNVTGEWSKNPQQYEIFHSALQDAKESGLLLRSASLSFLKWWQKMKFWIRYCEPPNTYIASAVRAAMPKKDTTDAYTLYAALANPDTPPPVVELLLALHPDSASQILDISSTPSRPSLILPLHVAALSSCYAARMYEGQVERSVLELTLKAYPEAVRFRFTDGRLPLHMAIASGHTWENLRHLVAEDLAGLKDRDPETKLLPFLLSSLSMNLSAEQQLRIQSIARNRFSETEWRQLNPRQRGKEILNVRKEYKLERLSTAFELLRQDASVIEKCRDTSETDATLDRVRECSLAIGEGGQEGGHDDAAASDSDDDVDSCEDEYDSEESEEWDSYESTEAESEAGTYATEYESSNRSRKTSSQEKKPAPSLTSFFAREDAESESEYVDDEPSMMERSVFECDASVLSGVDVMSLVSGAGNARVPRRTRRPNVSHRRIEDEERSMNIAELFGEVADESEHSVQESDESSEGFAEECTDDEGDMSGSDGSCAYDEDPDLQDASDGSDESLVYFQMRLNWKKNGKTFQADERESTQQARLIKKPEAERKSPSRSRSLPLDRSIMRKDSLRYMLISAQDKRNRANSDRNLSASAHSEYSDSYASLAPEDVAKLHHSTDMLWVSNQLYESNILGHQSQVSKASSEDDLYASFSSMRMKASSRQMKKSSSASNISSSMNSSTKLNNASTSSGASMALSNASTNIDLLESHSSFSRSAYEDGTLTSSYSTFARDDQTSGNSSFSTFANDHHDNAERLVMTNTSMLGSKLGSNHDESEESEEPDILSEVQSITSARDKLGSSMHSSSSRTPSLADYLSNSRHSTASARSKRSAASKRSSKSTGESKRSTSGRSDNCNSAETKQLDGQREEEDSKAGTIPQQRGLLNGLTAPLLDDESTDDVFCDMSKSTDGNTVESQMAPGSEDSAPLSPITTTETYFDRIEMRWKKRTSIASDTASSTLSNGDDILSSGGSDTNRDIKVAETLTSKLTSPGSSPVKVSTIVRSRRNTAVIGQGISVSVKTSDSTLASPVKFSKKSLLIADKSPGTKARNARAWADSVKKIAGELESPPSSTSKASTTNRRQPRSKRAAETLLSAASSPLKSIEEYRQLSPSLPPKESLKKLLYQDRSVSEKLKKSKAPSKTRSDAEPNFPGSHSRTKGPSSRSKTKRCLICQQNRCEVLMVPCRHLSLCRQCSAKRADISACPLCKEAVTDRMIIF